MSELRHRMIADMKLHGLAPGTQKVYVNAVSRLAGYFHRSPDQLSEQDLRDYFTYLVETKKVPSSTLRTQIFGVKFLFDKTLQRPWPTLKFLRARPSFKLPTVLDRAEAQRLLGLIRCPAVRACALLMYSCGLRISEALALQVKDIDSARMVVVVRAGKGNKDRHVPLSPRNRPARPCCGLPDAGSPLGLTAWSWLADMSRLSDMDFPRKYNESHFLRRQRDVTNISKQRIYRRTFEFAILE